MYVYLYPLKQDFSFVLNIVFVAIRKHNTKETKLVLFLRLRLTSPKQPRKKKTNFEFLFYVMFYCVIQKH